MASFADLERAAIDAYNSGDVEAAKQLKAQALATQEYESIERLAVDAYNSGDVETAKKLKQEALGILAPYEESKLTDIGRGLKAAPVMIAQGLVESGAAGADLAFGTDYSRGVTDAFENFRREYDLNPRTTGGEITEELVALGVGSIPIIGWLGRVNQAARGLSKVKAKSKFFQAADKFGASDIGKKLVGTRAGLIGTSALAIGGYEALVTPDGRSTISDAFDSAPDFLKTEDTLALGGSDLAATRLQWRPPSSRTRPQSGP